MQSLPLLHNSCRYPFRTGALITSTAAATATATSYFIQFQLSTCQNFRGKPLIGAAISGNSSVARDYPSIVLDSLRVLQWDQLCDCVASFAGTTIGKQATKEQLWNLNNSYEGSIRLLEETNAAVEMHKYGAMTEFSGIDVALILELVTNQPLIKFIEQLVDEDGSVKDSASSNLRHSRGRVQLLERKLYLLMESVIRNETKETATLVMRSKARHGIQKCGIKEVLKQPPGESKKEPKTWRNWLSVGSGEKQNLEDRSTDRDRSIHQQINRSMLFKARSKLAKGDRSIPASIDRSAN